MPPLYVEDEYRKCLDETEDESVFCSTITTIKSDNTSAVWKQIEVITKKVIFLKLGSLFLYF